MTLGRSMLVVVAGLLTILIASARVFATDRFFADITAKSANRQFQLDAKSPDNARGEWVPFQSDFKYTLTDTRTGKVLWTHKQAADGEASPMAAWVHDTGWSAVWTGWQELVIRAPDSSKPTAHVRILEQFPQDEYERHVHETTAGPMWSQSSRWYFAESEDRLHFIIRAWWGRRIIVETASGRIVPDEGAIHEVARAAERAEILSILQRAQVHLGPPGDPESGRHDHAFVSEVTAAAHLAGREKMIEAIPALFALEEWDYSGSSSMWPVWFDNPLPEGGVDPFAYRQFTVRTTAQIALRRLGAVPLGLPATEFKFEHPVYAMRWPVSSAIIGERAEWVAAVQPGMSPRDILFYIGAPDAVERFEETMAWEYDMDVEPPFTLLVIWTKDNPPKAASVRRLTPPRWASGDVRDDW